MVGEYSLRSDISSLRSVISSLLLAAPRYSRMTCPFCPPRGIASIVFSPTQGSGTITVIPYAARTDEYDRVHKHDPNILTQKYNCARGHIIEVQRGMECWCGWGEGIAPRLKLLNG